jgi:NADH:ubiquinone oxidoreductase subunit 2 (subunit N)
VSLLALSTATFRLEEQWGVLAVMGDPSLLWTTSLALSLIGGFVLLGTAPFHFWVSDVLQGVRPWLAPLSVTALQACGAAWISARLAGISSLPQAEHVVTGLLDAAAAAALVIGAVTITFQRRPERRVGTLASLNGALALVSLALAHGARRPMSAEPAPTAAWSIHLALALSGAGVLARFLPVSERIPEAAPVLFRRHPFWGCLGLYSLASLAGAPGTPGSFLWLETARQCVSVGRSGMAVLLGIAWTAAFAVVMRTVREAFGIATTDPPPPQRVPSLARWTMAIAFVGLATVMASRVR